jgi:allene oxide cyclase
MNLARIPRKLLVASTLALAAAALLLPVGSSAKPKQKVKTIEAFAVVDSAFPTDVGPVGDSLGDTIVFTQKLYSDETKTTQIGTDEAFCVRTVPGVHRLCTGIFYLRGGTITITGPETSGVHSLAITGGTGRFLGARGEVVLNSIDPVSDQVKFRIIKPRY